MEIAGETRSDARVASEGPRATIKNSLEPSRRTGNRVMGTSRPGGLSYREGIDI